MLFSGGRILVAAVGAIVLVVVAVFLVRSVWWDPTSKQEPMLPSAPTTATATSAPEPTSADTAGGGNTGGAPGGDAGAGAGAATSGAGSTSTGSTAKTPFTATTEKVQRILGLVAVDVELPQVEGGDPAVAAVFNDEMQAALKAQALSLPGGTLQDRPGSGVRIGQRVLSGLLRTAATDFTEATSTALASTVVVDAESGSIITLSSVFNDLTTGLARLQQESKKLGPSTAAGSGFDGSKLQPTEEVFARWTAETTGMHVLFEEGLVAPESAGIVEVTIPWDSLSDVMKPDVAQIVSS